MRLREAIRMVSRESGLAESDVVVTLVLVCGVGLAGVAGILGIIFG